MVAIIAFLAFAPAAYASPREDLHLQVALELKGRPASCLWMTPAYQSLFTEAARSFGGGESCGDGVEVMAALRRENSGKSFNQQRRRQLGGIRKAKVKLSSQRATVKATYPGTPPGWKQNSGAKTRELYQVEMFEGRWYTESVSAKVKPRR